MNIEHIFNEYLQQSDDLVLAQRTAKEIIEYEIKGLIDKRKKEEAVTGQKDTTHSMNFFHIQDPETGELVRHGLIESTVDDQIKRVELHRNKQYQWILSESYEIFREFIYKSYAYLGYKNKNIWPLKDFGNIHLDELDKKDYDFFYNQVRYKKGVPDSILNDYRKIFPKYKEIEVSNKIGKNLHLEINLIEEFRHIIVHDSGTAEDKDKTIRKILKNTGLLNNGNYDQNLYDYISSFFRLKDYENTICLLEIKHMDEEGEWPGRFTDILNNLINSLMAASSVIFKEIKTKIDE